MYEVMLKDERIDGKTPDWDGMSGFSVSVNDRIETILSWVRDCHRSHGVMEELGVTAHGYARFYGPGIDFGGHGVQLGKDGIYVNNANKWRAIRGMAKRIILYACNAAQVDPFASGEPDGRQLCRQLAIESATPVMAGVRTQYYDRSSNPLHWNEVKQGNWDGPVFLFSPNGTVTNVTPWAGAN